jgi:hypothetical protein
MLTTTRNRWVVALAVFALVLAFTPYSQAQDDWTKRTLVTVNRAIEVPGKVLPPGKYIFQIMDLQAERNVVRITNERGDKVYATLIAIPTERFQAKSDTVFLFHEAERGRPDPLRAWFYPDHLRGVEFVYPKTRAVQLAAETEEYVIAEKTPAPAEPTVAQLAEEPVVAVTPRGTEVAVAEAPAAKEAPQPTPAPAVIEAAPPPPLPATGTELPLLGLIGVAAAAAASAIRLYRR